MPCRGLIFKQVLPGLGPLLETLRRIAKKRGKTVSQVAFSISFWLENHSIDLILMGMVVVCGRWRSIGVYAREPFPFRE